MFTPRLTLTKYPSPPLSPMLLATPLPLLPIWEVNSPPQVYAPAGPCMNSINLTDVLLSTCKASVFLLSFFSNLMDPCVPVILCVFSWSQQLFSLCYPALHSGSRKWFTDLEWVRSFFPGYHRGAQLCNLVSGLVTKGGSLQSEFRIGLWPRSRPLAFLHLWTLSLTCTFRPLKPVSL